MRAVAQRRLDQALAVLDSFAAPTIAAASTNAFRAAHRVLGKLVGSAGFDAILTRSFRDAVARYPSPDAAPKRVVTSLETIADIFAGRAEAESRTLAGTAIAHFVDLLSALVGADLATRLLVGAWPTLASSSARADTEKDRS
jgi:hypothetical protein